MVGTGSASSAAKAAWPSRLKASASSGPCPRISAMSAPAANARPSPVTTTARSSRCARQLAAAREQRLQRGAVERVERLRPGQGEHRHGAALLGSDHLHRSLLSSRADPPPRARARSAPTRRRPRAAGWIPARSAHSSVPPTRSAPRSPPSSRGSAPARRSPSGVHCTSAPVVSASMLPASGSRAGSSPGSEARPGSRQRDPAQRDGERFGGVVRHEAVADALDQQNAGAPAGAGQREPLAPEERRMQVRILGIEDRLEQRERDPDVGGGSGRRSRCPRAGRGRRAPAGGSTPRCSGARRRPAPRPGSRARRAAARSRGSRPRRRPRW